MVVSSLVALWSLELPVYQLLFALWYVAAAAFVLGWLMRPTVDLTGHGPTQTVTGEPAEAQLTLTNRGRTRAYDLSVGWFGLPQEVDQVDAGRALPVLEPGESATVPVTLVAKRRGLYPLPEPRPYTTFPLNLCRTPARVRARTPQSDGRALLALPRFHPLDHLDVPVSARYQPGGIALSSNVGESPEYVGSREYHAGDPLRRLDHRSWARLAKPVVREYHEEYYCRIALVLDTFVPGRARPPAQGFPSMEAAVSLAASVADALSRGEYIIDIFAAGPELYVFRAGRHTAHLDNVLEILACVEPCRSNPFDKVAPALADELASVSTVIALLLDWDASREELLHAAAEHGCAAKVVVVRSGDTTQPFSGLEGKDSFVQIDPRHVQEGGVGAL